MTAIQSSTSAIKPALIRPPNVNPGAQAPAAKVGANPLEGDIATPRFRSASFQGAQFSRPGSTPGPEVNAPGFRAATFKGAQISRPAASPPTPNVDVFQVRSASISTPKTPEADPPVVSSISGDTPEVTLELKIEKALDSAMRKFEKGGGGNIAELGRVLYDAVWNTLQDAGETNTPVKAAMAVNQFIQSMKDGDAPANPNSVGAAAIAERTPFGETPSVGSEFGSGLKGARALDIRI